MWWSSAYRMDNLTHTLAGVLIGESIWRFAPADPSGLAPPQRRSLLVVLSALCSNLPDADLLYTMAAANKLVYLSQHRGYTHTIAGLLAAAAMVILAGELWMRWRRLGPTRGDRNAILIAVSLSLVLHLALDYTNSYGVHPFWPVHNHWMYGDAVFIIEPLLWTCAAPLIFLLRSVVARALVAAVLAAALALSFGTQWIHPASGVALGTLMLLLLYAGWKASAKLALLCAFVAWLAVTAIFFAASDMAAKRVSLEFAGQWPKVTLLDHVLTPLPSNPVCWNVIAVTLEGDQYALRRGVLSTAPGIVGPRMCPDWSLDVDTTAPMRRIAGRNSSAVHWLDEYSVPRAEFPRLLRAYCEAAIFMRFARAPWIDRRGGHWTIGDLRYDREPEIGFAELELSEHSHACAIATPPWVAPRRELLAPAP
jgi:inner membrane protein